ncbi:transporter substrate-binding domain-containing protein [Actinoplanes siamensis]|uniref:Solute-binding protein family 3/N-terminal domain-containing protein n=1 Tax=Actinoplanes siamensis TaxID=1223317 RepID=A0A919NCW4_9ACTN|nr:transporter substrate-binding domain-containing protein [Actinoplanes siamensis]GIF08325.1 hypothetical protein Asi03nite_58630 [Actinoplanes siamensis]
MGIPKIPGKAWPELFGWAFPTAAAVALAIRIGLLSLDANAVNFTGVGIAAGLAIVAALLTRLGPAQGGSKFGIWPAIGSSTVTVLLVAWAFIWPAPIGDDKPSLYFSGTVKVGVSGDIPGWPEFDEELIKWIADEYGIQTEEIRLFQREREEALKDKRVDMVVSSYTATISRTNEVDFAGPYYLDTTGVWGNAEKIKKGIWTKRIPGVANPTVCGVLGTTGNNPMQDFINTQDPKNGGAVADSNYQTTADCLRRLFDPESEVSYAATDWSTLKAYNPNAAVFDANRRHPNIEAGSGSVKDGDPGLAGWRTGDKPQYYGVAIRNDHPATCRDLTRVIRQFVEQTKNPDEGYGHAYSHHLKSLLGPLKTDWHRPNFDALDWGPSGSPICV